MLKKIIILPALFLALAVIEFACCRCTDGSLPYFKLVASGPIYTQNPDNTRVNENQSTNADSVFLSFLYKHECVAWQSKPSSLFSSAMATSCGCSSFCGSNGIKTPIKEMIFTANAPFNGISAGNSINQFINITSSIYHRDSISYSNMNRFNDSIKANPYIIDRFFRAHVFKPTSTFTGKFRANLIFTNGDTIKSESYTVRWL